MTTPSPPQIARIRHLHAVEGLSVKTIAHRLKLPVSAVKRAVRAMKGSTDENQRR